MGVKAEVDHSYVEIDYPWLGQSDMGTIILFSSKDTGTVVFSGRKNWKVGYHATDWAMKEFKPISGKVTLSNE